MKTIFTLLALNIVGAMAAFAQPAEGYYRVKNAQTNRYVSLVNNQVDKANRASLEKGGGGYLYSLRMKDQAEVISDPGSIIYVTPASNEDYKLEGQGLDTYKLTSLYLNMFTGTRTLANGTVFGSTLSGAYWMYGTASGATRYIFDCVNKTDIDYDYDKSKVKGYSCLYAAGNQGEWKVSDKKANWYFNKVDNTKEYLGLTPEVEVGGKWYTTIYCSFPFKVTEGMKVYTIKKYWDNATEAQIVEVEDGIVPANTAVIIECSSNEASNNKVIPLTAAEASGKSVTSVLKGTYFCYIYRGPNGLDENTDMGLKNATPYYASQMRVLGSANGKLALVKPSENSKDKQLVVTTTGKYMPANKAFLKWDNGKVAQTVTLTTGEVGIISTTQDMEEDTDIYNLQGQKVASKGTKIDELPRGLYIVNGKKIIKE
ncbi:MAG: hypothetical protein J6Z18_04555 [Prevotella sp.]|nr:hypothetical protein [Prevotella sp.]